MTNVLVIVTVVLLVGVLLVLYALKKNVADRRTMVASRLDAFEKAQERIERAVREEVALEQRNSGRAAREQRQELTDAFKSLR